MAFYDDYNNLNHHPITSATAEFGEFPFLNQPPTVEPLNNQAHDSLADRWGMVGQRRPTVGSPISPLGREGFGRYCCDVLSHSRLTRESLDPVAAATLYTGFDGHAHPSYTDSCLSKIGQEYHPEHASFSGWNTFPAGSMMALGTSTMSPTPGNGKGPFYFSTLRNRMLTNLKQPRFTTGGRSKMAPRSARLTK